MIISRIGKCRSCKATSRRDYTETITKKVREWAQVGVSTYEREITQVGRTINGRWRRHTEDLECPRCGEWAWNSKPIDGFRNEHVCDPRCTSAQGHNCECSCGGANHGRDYLVCEAVAA